MIIKLPRRSEEFEKELGIFWAVHDPSGNGILYVVKNRIPDTFLSRLPEGSVININDAAPLASRLIQGGTSRVRIGDAEFGGEAIIVCAGPCAVENWQQIQESAKLVKAAGARVLRGGAFKPRTSPYSFQGLGEEGLRLLREASDAAGIPVLTEATSPDQVGPVAKYADGIQIGARNMQNFELLKAAGVSGKPVVLKRGISATIEEWLLSAEYILLSGNWKVILCERGIRTFETATRNVLDVAGMALAKATSHLPVIADPSHATGRRDLVLSASKASIAAGADGLLIEVHPKPESALSDGPQSLTPDQFKHLMGEVEKVAKAVGRSCI
ncbi:MAG: 3-deoxy-7-phosphoheptulonate synthase [Candidatus Methanomethylicus sp.]|nr:3-deoxy-7-phosphoheptulonate synthase [Candidatus Methanomethylicus sp.]